MSNCKEYGDKELKLQQRDISELRGGSGLQKLRCTLYLADFREEEYSSQISRA